MRNDVRFDRAAFTDATIEVCPQQRIVWFNAEAEELLGLTPEDLGIHLNELIPIGKRPRHVEHVSRMFRNPTVRPMASARLKVQGICRATGQALPLFIGLTPTMSETGDCLGYFAQITKRPRGGIAGSVALSIARLLLGVVAVVTRGDIRPLLSALAAKKCDERAEGA